MKIERNLKLHKTSNYVNINWNLMNNTYYSKFLKIEYMLKYIIHFNLNKFKRWDWLEFILNNPQCSENCNWDILNGTCWESLLSHHPQFAEHCNWDKLKGNNWSYLLREQPQLGEYCEWSKLNYTHKLELISKLPQFRIYFD